VEVWGDKIIMEQQNESGERRMWVKAGGCGYRLQTHLIDKENLFNIIYFGLVLLFVVLSLPLV